MTLSAAITKQELAYLYSTLSHLIVVINQKEQGNNLQWLYLDETENRSEQRS